MEPLKQVVGIDVSKDSLEVVFGSVDAQQNSMIGTSLSFTNDPCGFARFIAWMSRLARVDVPLLVVMESTGVYHERLAHWLCAREIDLSVVLATQAKNFHRSTGTKTKTDAADAAVLCRMGLERKLPLWEPPSHLAQTIRSRLMERRQCVRMRGDAQRQLHAMRKRALGDDPALCRKEDLIDYLDGQITQIEQEVTELLGADPELCERVDAVCTIPGVSRLTVLGVLSETDFFRKVPTQRQLVSYAGLDISENSSGTFTGKARLSKRGNSNLRTLLFMPALTAIRCSPEFKRFAARISTNNGSGTAGNVAMMRKLLRLIYSLWKSGQTYCPQPAAVSHT